MDSFLRLHTNPRDRIVVSPVVLGVLTKINLVVPDVLPFEDLPISQ